LIRTDRTPMAEIGATRSPLSAAAKVSSPNP
jgi:hypothetical protein